MTGVDRASDRIRLAAIAGPCTTSQSAQLEPIIEPLRARFGRRFVALIYYGACLRDGDPYAGLLDFYVVVDEYGPPGQSRLGGWCNRLVPPNVYYAERTGADGRLLRCKYAVLSRDQLEAGCRDWFQSSVWGRFAQPVAIVAAASDDDRQRTRAACGQAVVTLLDRALPALADGRGPAATLSAALSLSYASELRVEKTSRSRSLVERDSHEYARRLEAARPLLARPVTTDSAGRLYWCGADSPWARLRWRLRRACGKSLSILRLAKACFTFTDAVDYAAYKIERHTGVVIPVDDRLRRHPLIFGWLALWRVYRQRLLR
ncbi:hypothetical protein [Salinisphaera sp. T31B1]|uniref:hypothetical protein n=1 Tax=Salinisphaera sp. T31B1 TaxID=727963 RepID=UPI00333FA30E